MHACCPRRVMRMTQQVACQTGDTYSCRHGPRCSACAGGADMLRGVCDRAVLPPPTGNHGGSAGRLSAVSAADGRVDSAVAAINTRAVTAAVLPASHAHCSIHSAPPCALLGWVPRVCNTAAADCCMLCTISTWEGPTPRWRRRAQSLRPCRGCRTRRRRG